MQSIDCYGQVAVVPDIVAVPSMPQVTMQSPVHEVTSQPLAGQVT